MRAFAVAVMAGGLALGACANTAGRATDFGGWDAIGDIPWRTDGGTAEAGPYKKAGFEEMGFLVSPGTYADFRLRVDFWVDADTNSGIMIRCASAETITPTAYSPLS